MHGADWPAIKRKYAAFLPDLATRSDLYRVIRWMLSELAVGHSYLFPPERLDQRRGVPGGLLGADYEVANGRYRFKKVYGGLNWNPGLRSPLTAAGVDVKAGEYLLAVRGIELQAADRTVLALREHGRKEHRDHRRPQPRRQRQPHGHGRAAGRRNALRNRDWVEGNLKRVREATGGRVAYVYVPDTAGRRPRLLQALLLSAVRQATRSSSTSVSTAAAKWPTTTSSTSAGRPLSMWATRYGEDVREPGAAIQGPKVMLIDETAGSGGDMLPWMFRKLHLGPLVGKRTWGGLVGILGNPVLMDGGSVTAPNLAIWTEDGWVVENEGVPPDVEVEQWPADVIAGKDPQLEKAIEIVLDELSKEPAQAAPAPAVPGEGEEVSGVAFKKSPLPLGEG